MEQMSNPSYVKWIHSFGDHLADLAIAIGSASDLAVYY